MATARPTFVVAAGEARAAAARALLADLGADVAGPNRLLTTVEDARRAAESLDGAAELNILICATFSDAAMALALYGDATRPVLLWAFREPGPPGDRLWLNSLCAANLAAHALVDRGVRVRLLYGDPDEPPVRAELAALLRDGIGDRADDGVADGGRVADGGHADEAAAAHGLARLRGASIGTIGDAPSGFTPCEADADGLARLLGIRLEHLELDDALAAVRAVPEPVRQAMAARAAGRSSSLNALPAEEVDRAAAVTEALGGWAEAAGLDALAVRCWPEFPVDLGVCPCSSLGSIHGGGTPAACERDVNGAATMLLLEALGSGPNYLMDLVDVDEVRNVATFWHCGSAPQSLAADPAGAEQGVHCNRRIGVAGNFALRAGRVTIARLSHSAGRFRLLVSGGEALPAANRFQGNTAEVRLDAAAGHYVDELVALGFEHHSVLAWTDLRPALRGVGKLLHIPVFEW